MVSIANFRFDPKDDGEWVTVGQQGKQFKIKTRGVTGRYRDRLAQLRRTAVREANRALRPGEFPVRQEDLDPTVDDRCQAKALAEECILDVEGLTNADGSVTTVAQFKDYMVLDDFRQVVSLALGAALDIGQRVDAEAAAAAKNSEPVSAGN